MDENKFKLQRLFELNDLSKISKRLDLIEEACYAPLTFKEGDSQEEINLKILLDLFTMYENLFSTDNNTAEVESVRVRISPLIERLMKMWGYEFDKSVLVSGSGYDCFSYVSVFVVSRRLRDHRIQDAWIFEGFKKCFVKSVEL